MKVALKNMNTLKRVVVNDAECVCELENVTLILLPVKENNEECAKHFTETGFPTGVVNDHCVIVVNNELIEFVVDDNTEIQKIKQLRKDGDNLIQRVKNLPPSRELSLSITKFQEAVMWMGMELKRRNEENPYPSSKDPSTGDKIEPTADGLKL